VDVIRRKRGGLAYAVALAVLVVGAASSAVFAQDHQLSVHGGTVHVERVLAAAPPRHAMPGMGTDNDPVPDGKRRVTVDVTLVADDRESLQYSVDRFSLDTGDADARPHRAVLPGTTVPAGAQLSGSLVFDVPTGATQGVLTFSGRPGGTVVTLPDHTAPPVHHGN
jgi:hypothetical protein